MARPPSLELHQRDDTRRYEPAENERLDRNLSALLTEIRADAFGERPIDTRLLCELHRRLFDGVRDHAGKHRDRGFGAEHLSYGPHRSSSRDHVARDLKKLFEAFRPVLLELQDGPPSRPRDEKILSTALKLHAEIIRIHPFEDGNGRTSRALLNLVLGRFGLPSIAFQVPKQEYLDCLNAYFNRRGLDALVDLALRALTGS